MLTSELLLESLRSVLSARRWLVAFSGGIDSTVLLHAVTQLAQHSHEEQKNPLPEIVAVHVNHNLQQQSQQWAASCENYATSLGVKFQLQSVTIERNSGSLEDAARRARYSCFESLLTTGDVLLMGHHSDDQAETLLLRLLRGSGSRGLAGMPVQRHLAAGRLFRPLLHYMRRDIESYARAHKLNWIEDSSNRDTQFDRNFLRLEILPLLQQRWPGYRNTLSRAVQLHRESADLNDDLAEMDLAMLKLPEKNCLPIGPLLEFSDARQKNLIRYWLVDNGLAPPNFSQMQALLRDVVGAVDDAVPQLSWPSPIAGGERVQVRRFRQHLYAGFVDLPFNAGAVYPWDLKAALPINGIGVLEVFSPADSVGSALQKNITEKGEVTIRFRQGGERCRPMGRHKSQSVKKLMQEYNIPPWLRDRIPLLYVDETLAAAIGYWVCEGYGTDSGPPLHIRLRGNTAH